MKRASEKRRLDPVATRQTILNAAVTVFAELGFAGASIGEIANEAGVPKSLVQYHFGPKDQLWQTCIHDRVEPLLSATRRLLAGDLGDPVEPLAARFALLRDNPEIVRLLAAYAFTNPQTAAENPDAALFAVLAMDGWFAFRSLYGASRADGDAFLAWLARAAGFKLSAAAQAAGSA